jgi:hypothetical protein
MPNSRLPNPVRAVADLGAIGRLSAIHGCYFATAGQGQLKLRLCILHSRDLFHERLLKAWLRGCETFVAAAGVVFWRLEDEWWRTDMIGQMSWDGFRDNCIERIVLEWL